MKQPKALSRFFRRAVYAIQAHRIDAYSAQSAFFIFLSFFPFVMLLSGLVKELPLFESWRTDLSFSMLPAAVSELLSTILNEIATKSTGAILGFSAVAVLWSASKGFYAINRGLRCVYRQDEDHGYVFLRLSSLLYTLLFLFFLIAIFVLFVFGRQFFDLIIAWKPSLSDRAFLIAGIRNLLLLVFLTFFFTLLYWLIPGRRYPLRMQLPGALLCSLGWILFTFLFTLYTDHFGNYSYLYGSLTAVVLFMLWLYFCMYILFLGAELNSLLQADLLVWHSRRREARRVRIQKRRDRRRLKKEKK